MNNQERSQQSQQPSGQQSEQSQPSKQKIGGKDSNTGGADDRGSTYQQSSAGDPSYAEQGRGAPDEESSDSSGTSDIETERSQGRENDIEGSSL